MISSALAAVLLAAMPVGCSTESEMRGDPTGPPLDVSLSWSQHRVDEGSARANLRVVNHGGQDLPVTAIGVDSPGYGRYVEDHDSVVPPGQTIDLRMTLPEPVCDADPVPAYGIVRSGDRIAKERLDPQGQDFLKSLWRRRCNQLSVTNVADLSWDWGDYEAVGTGRRSYLPGALVVQRVPGTDTPLRVVGMQGSVLFRLEPQARPTLGPDDQRVEVPVRLRWGRCDAHAIGESSQTFLWKVDVKVGDAPPVRITTTVEDAAKAPLLGYLRDACS
ncbi:hypothetical protein EKO23_06930 [Nocardioides guangzhouensis]|uniref:DUF4232 domain-containing protein n=1 Tax=Nocardioides guangzhouensis TaxID=2497878 RepID=A0A4Q4ZHU3_9ACTN|nr:hypothetical protein EKO23_06930 [Nocardioides guangzhouensis]